MSSWDDQFNFNDFTVNFASHQDSNSGSSAQGGESLDFNGTNADDLYIGDVNNNQAVFNFTASSVTFSVSDTNGNSHLDALVSHVSDTQTIPINDYFDNSSASLTHAEHGDDLIRLNFSDQVLRFNGVVGLLAG